MLVISFFTSLVRLIEVIDQPDGDMLYLVMEYVGRNSVANKISKGTLSLRHAWDYFRDAV
jgi:serine/threonine protein kinase